MDLAKDIMDLNEDPQGQESKLRIWDQLMDEKVGACKPEVRRQEKVRPVASLNTRRQ